MGQQLQAPVTTKVLERWSTGDEEDEDVACFRAGVASMMGWRSQMEDRYVVNVKGGSGVLGVFDGHGGDECSSFLAQRVPEEVTEDMSCEDLTRLALSLDQEYLDSSDSNTDFAGSTSTVCIVSRSPTHRHYRLTVSHVGDCKLLLCRRRTLETPSLSYSEHGMFQTVSVGGERIEVLVLTRDHRPDDEYEEQRIIAANGSVVNSRVNGTLATSRAFGDSRFKKGGNDDRSHQVTAVPDVVTFDDCRKGDVLIACSDGVFEGAEENARLSEAALVSLIFKELATNGDSLASAAAVVCDEALKRGSRDNITCLVANIGDDTKQSASVLNLQRQVPGRSGSKGSFGSDCVMSQCVSPTAGARGGTTYADSSINLAEILNLAGLASDGKKLVQRANNNSDRLTRIRTIKPGPISHPESPAYMLAYSAAASEGGLSASEAVERRYSHITRLYHVKGQRALSEVEMEELEGYWRDMPKDVATGKRADRTDWFSEWLEGKREGSTDGFAGNGLLLDDETSDEDDVLMIYCNTRDGPAKAEAPSRRAQSLPPDFSSSTPLPRRRVGFGGKLDTSSFCHAPTNFNAATRFSERDREEVITKIEEDGEAICGGEGWWGVLDALEDEVRQPTEGSIMMATRAASTIQSSESCSLTTTLPSQNSNMPFCPSPMYTFGAAEVESDTDSENELLNHCVS